MHQQTKQRGGIPSSPSMKKESREGKASFDHVYGSPLRAHRRSNQIEEEMKLKPPETPPQVKWDRMLNEAQKEDEDDEEDLTLEDRNLLPLGALEEELRDMYQQLPASLEGRVSRSDLCFVLEDEEVRTLFLTPTLILTRGSHIIPNPDPNPNPNPNARFAHYS